jgi:hypothetical protein
MASSMETVGRQTLWPGRGLETRPWPERTNLAWPQCLHQRPDPLAGGPGMLINVRPNLSKHLYL